MSGDVSIPVELLTMSGIRSSIANSIKKELQARGYEPGPKVYTLLGLAAISSIALLIIGCIGAAGILPGSTIGWATVGLGGGGCLCIFASGNIKKRKFELIKTALVGAAFISLGVLGGMGILSAAQVGWGIIGTTCAPVVMNCVQSCLKTRKTEHLNND